MLFDQIKLPGEIVMLADSGLQQRELGFATALELTDGTIDLLEDPPVGETLAAGLEAGYIGFDLLDEQQPFAKRDQPAIRRMASRIRTGSALGDQRGVELVVLGSAQLIEAESAHLPRLQQDDLKASLMQIRNHVALISAGGFDPDPSDPLPLEPVSQSLPAVGVVGHFLFVAHR